MDIYEPNSSALDLDAARDALKAYPLLRNKEVQRETTTEIQIAALLDIAQSLRIVAAESGRAMQDQDYADGIFDDVEPDDERRDFFVIGDLVHLDGRERVGTIVKLGFDGDHAPTADVDFGEGGPVMTYYASNLIRLVGDEKPHVSTDEEDAAMIDIDIAPELFEDSATNGMAEQAIIAERDGAYYPPAESAGIEDDFAEPESAVDVLRANEAKKKAAKKSTKGKKS